MRHRFLVFALTLAVVVSGSGSGATQPATVTATLNGLEITLDADTGGILRLSHAGPGKVLDTTPRAAGILDLATPGNNLSLRLSPRFTPGASIRADNRQIEISWNRLLGEKDGARPAGYVAATAILTAAPDGRSVVLRCSVQNQSTQPLRQVLFPDLNGLLPLGSQTELRSGGIVVRPFADLTPSAADRLMDNPHIAVYSTARGLYSPIILRWLDYGTLQGGLSLFARQWGADPPLTLMVQLRDNDRKLRLMVVHAINLAPGATWRSPEYWLTLHEAGWAKGIEPYRAWVGQNIKRIAPVPEHVRRGLGFRSLWFSRCYPADPQNADWTFRDLAPLAEESKEHGLDEMVLWSCQESFLLPLPCFHQHLGGDAGLVRAAAECRKRGVNLAPFISVCNAKEKTAARYGLKAVATGWTYHPEFIPRFNPPYANAYACAQIDTRHPVWRREVLDSCKRLVDMGLPSICWDEFIIEPPEPNLLTLTRQIRQYARRRDPQSTFSGEEVTSMDASCDYLDYTWNWTMLMSFDCLATTSVFPSPRINLNIDASAAEVKHGFVLNRYLNIQPRKPDGANGTDYIRNHRELSAALKQCAKLRAQFLPYFLDGTLVGDCILNQPCPQTVLGTYLLPQSALLVVLNTGPRRTVELSYNLAPWLASGSGKYRAMVFNGSGASVGSVELARPAGRLVTELLETNGLAVVEIVLL